MSALEKLFKDFREETASKMDKEEKASWVKMFNNIREIIQLSEEEYDNLASLLIPTGPYCYDENGVCPYWHKDKDNAVICTFMDVCDYTKCSEEYWKGLSETDKAESSIILWDQCKICGMNEEG